MESFWMFLIGLVGGLLGGLLGVGGSIIMIPLLTLLFGPRQHLHQAAAMIVNFFVGAPAAVQHFRARAVVGSVVRYMVPTAGLCVIFGVLASELPVFRTGGGVYLTGVFGVFLLGVAVDDACKAVGGRDSGQAHDETGQRGPVRRTARIVGVVTGFLGGLLGLGGGFIAVPLQRRLLGLPLRNAIANSAVAIVLLSAIGAALKNYALVTQHGHHLAQSLRLAAILIPGAVLGSLVGSRLTHVLPVRAVHWAFIVFLLAAAVRMISYAFAG